MISRNRAFSIIRLLLLMLIVAVSTAHSQKFGKVSDEEWLTGAPATYPEANSIILFDRAEIDVTKDIIKIDFHVRIKVLTAAGKEEVGERSFTYDKEHEKVKNFKAHTILPGNKKHKVEKEAIFDKEVGDWTERVIVFPSVQAGCILEYKYTIKSDRFDFLKPWYFQSDVFTALSQVTVCLVPGFSYDLDFRNVPRPQQEAKVDRRADPSATHGMSHMEAYTWTMENLPPITDEPYMSCINDYRSAIRFQIYSFTYPSGSVFYYLKDWTAVGEEFEQFLKGYLNKQGTVEDTAHQVTAGLATPREQSEALFRNVASEYQTTEARPRHWFEHEKLSRLLEEKHGHGEDKNMLLVQMHRALGIEAWPVLISTRSNSQFNPQFPSWVQFNYLICFVQFADGWEFLDAANEHAVYGLLPPECLTDGGFLIDGSNSDLVKMTIKPVESSRSDLTRMYLASDGSVTCSTSCEFSGYFAAAYGDRYDQAEPDDFVQDNFLDRLDGTCELQHHDCALDSTNQFAAAVVFTSGDLVRKLDNNLLVKPVRYAFADNPFKSEKRFFPVDFIYPFNYLNRVELYCDGKVQEFTAPEDLLVEIGGAKFERKSVDEDSCVIVTSLLTIDMPLFKPFKYEALREFFDSVALASEDEAVVVLEGIE